MKESPSCKYCNLDTTIEHFCWHCTYAANVWRRLTAWWNRIVDEDFKLQGLSELDILFGIKSTNIYTDLLNEIILCAN